MNTPQTQPPLAASAGSAIIGFVIYSVLYAAIILGIFGWAVFVKGHSGWWIVMAMVLLASQYGPNDFGIASTPAPNAPAQPRRDGGAA